jgi:hypothetical protein
MVSLRRSRLRFPSQLACRSSSRIGLRARTRLLRPGWLIDAGHRLVGSNRHIRDLSIKPFYVFVRAAKGCGGLISSDHSLLHALLQPQMLLDSLEMFFLDRDMVSLIPCAMTIIDNSYMLTMILCTRMQRLTVRIPKKNQVSRPILKAFARTQRDRETCVITALVASLNRAGLM